MRRTRKRGPVLTCWLALWLPFLLLMPSVAADAERLPIKTYTTADGLGDSRVNRIVKDSRGFLWFCTSDGLSRFDGYAFTNFGNEHGLPHAPVRDLLETRAGAYWVATNSGLFRFDPTGSPVPPDTRRAARTAVPMFARVAQDDGDRHAAEISVVREARDGTIWVGSNKELYRLDQTGGHVALRRVEIGLLNSFPEQREIVDLLEDRRRSLWIATRLGLYRRRADGSTARYAIRDGLPGESFSSLLEDHEGHLWATTRDAGFFRLKDNDGRATPVVDVAFHQKDGLPHYWVNHLFQTSDHRFWVATWAGIAEFFPTGDPEGRHFRAYGTRNGLTEMFVAGITEDIGGNLWLRTDTVGAMKIARDGFTTYGERDGINYVHAIFEDGAGNLCFKGWVLGDARTSVFEGAKLALVTASEPSRFARFGCFDGRRFDWFQLRAIKLFGWVLANITLQARSGEWWVGSEGGLYRFPRANHFAQLQKARPLARYTATDPTPGTQVFRLFEDSSGNIWVSTHSAATGGLFRWEPHDGRVRDLADAPGLPPLKNQTPRSFAEDASGNIWIGFHGVLARYARGVFTTFTASEGLPPGEIKNMHVDRLGRLWLASTQSGLIRIDDPGAERPAFVNYTTTNGLSSNGAEVIIDDRRGYLYVGGRHGVDRLDPATGRVKRFTTADGLAPGTVGAAYRDRRGVLWFGTSAGLARLAPAPAESAVAPPVVITGFQVSGVPERVSALGEREMSFLAFPPHRNHLQIDFLGLGFGSGEVLRYQYKLEGSDAEWSPLSQHRTVTYGSLASGRYTFAVRAVNSDGIMSVTPAVITFTILRPVWQRPWVIALGLLATALATQAVYRYRLGRALEMANMRTRIATDLHDDIGANLTRIALLSEVATRQDASAGRATQGTPSASIARIARESVGSMSDIVWAVNPARDSLLDLTRRMRQYAEETLVLSGIELRFEADEAREHQRLGGDIRRDLLLIFKEAVNNTARHSRCSRVVIEFGVHDSDLILRVSDNGVGFDPAHESEGLGVLSMHRRAQRLKGTLVITSPEGLGTTVTLTIPR